MNIEASKKTPPPPLLYLGGFGIGWLIDRILPLSIVSDNLKSVEVVIGGTLIVTGLFIMITGLYTFKKAHTSITPNLKTKQLITTGPYRFSRNPLYTGWAVTYIGVLLVMNIIWCIFTLAIIMVIFNKVIIPREEEYLRNEFGESYLLYSKQVRRWL